MTYFGPEYDPYTMVATISRERLFKSPTRNSRFSWKWLYYSSIEGRNFGGFESLAQAVGHAKRQGANKIIKTWKR